MDWNDPAQVREYKRIKAAEYRKKNPEKYKENSRKYNESHKELNQKRWRDYGKTPAGKARDKKYRDSHPEKIKLQREKAVGRHLRFKGKHVWLSYNPRIGICSQCHRSVVKGEIKITNLHHFKYDEQDPLAHTIELCVKCHNELEPRNRDSQGNFINP